MTAIFHLMKRVVRTEFPMKSSHALTHSPLLAKNTLLNLIGYGSPLIVAIFCIPKIVAGMGTDRFGILTLAWVLIGYFGILDLGLGRALTMVVAEKLGSQRTSDIPSTVWTALLAMLLVAIPLSVTVIFCSHWITYDVLKIPAPLKQETLKAFMTLGFFIPVVTVSVGFRGLLEAYQRFDLVNIIRIPLGIFSFAAPLAVISFTVNLQVVILVLCIVRVAAVCVQFMFCCKIIPGLIRYFAIETRQFWTLMRFGGWMTVTNIINPLLVYVDRLAIGALLSITAVTFYATPSEVITKLTLLSGALMSVLFPAISSSFRIDRQRSALLLERGLKYVFLAIFPIVLLLVTFAPEGLAIWLDEGFMQNSTTVARILSAGVFFTCLGQIPYAFIQGAGRPDITGKLHLIELPAYLILLVLSINVAGIVGAAMMWTLRFAIDTIAMYLIAQKLLGIHRLDTCKKVSVLLLSLASLAVPVILQPFYWRALGCFLVLTVFVWSSLRYFLSAEEKDFLKKVNRSHQKTGEKHRA
jgi:O-antigen/teichoic acid export membrane protein